MINCFRFLLTVALVSFAGCATNSSLPAALQQSNEVPGKSIVTMAAALRADVLKNLGAFTQAKYQCSSPVVTNTIAENVEGDVTLDQFGRLHSGHITERWEIDSCGKARQLRLVIGPDGKGGNFIAIGEIEK